MIKYIVNNEGYLFYNNNGSVITHYTIDVSSTLLTGLRAYYKMDETEGTTTYDSRGIYNGTINNEPSLNGPGIKQGYTFHLDANQYTQIDSSVADFGTDDFTVAFWFNADSLEEKYIYGNYASAADARIRAYLAANGNIVGYIMIGPLVHYINLNAENYVTPGEWNHIIYHIDRDGSFATFFNGVMQTSGDLTAADGSSFSGGSDLCIGKYGVQHATASLPASIDEFGLWERLLTQEEKEELYNSGSGLTYPFV